MIIHGDCLEEMKKMGNDSISCIVTDPPYGLKFMGKQWDHGIPGIDYWKECLRICKPGSFLLAFGGTRTYHRLTCAIEDAGWEIRDCIIWIYGTGFPKSHNHFGIEGYGTALKPAFEPIIVCSKPYEIKDQYPTTFEGTGNLSPNYEPIIMAMKPVDKTFKNNAEKWGQAGINIEECRIAGSWNRSTCTINDIRGGNFIKSHIKRIKCLPQESNPLGRWPANVILDEESADLLAQQKGVPECASRFFYCAKASTSERNEGLDGLPYVQCQMGCSGAMPIDDDAKERDRFKKISKNYHPTVKPLKLMEYLIKLVMPPKDGLLLDPFSGSGTTIVAAKRLGFNAIGIEKESQYCQIAEKRLEAIEA